MKESRFCTIYKKDKKDLDRTIAQYSSSNITPLGFDVLHHNFDNLAAIIVVVECHKVKCNHGDYDGAGLVEKETQMMYHTRKGQKDS